MARDDPLDAHLLDHPELIFDRPVEQTVLCPQNPYVLGPHLAAAAQEAPLKPGDERWFGETMSDLAAGLSTQGLLRGRPAGWFWTRPSARWMPSTCVGRSGVRSRSLRPAPGEWWAASTGVADRTVHEGASTCTWASSGW